MQKTGCCTHLQYYFPASLRGETGAIGGVCWTGVCIE